MTRNNKKMTPEEYAEHAAEVLRRKKRPITAEHRQRISEGTRVFWILARKTLAEQEAQNALPLTDA